MVRRVQESSLPGADGGRSPAGRLAQPGEGCGDPTKARRGDGFSVVAETELHNGSN